VSKKPVADADVRPAPLYIGPANCEAVVGLPWRRVRDHARELGLPLVQLGKTRLVPADALAALRARVVASESAGPLEHVDAAEQIRRRLGVKRVDQ